MDWCNHLGSGSTSGVPHTLGRACWSVMLGLGRALGETMAITFIIGNSFQLPNSYFHLLPQSHLLLLLGGWITKNLH